MYNAYNILYYYYYSLYCTFFVLHSFNNNSITIIQIIRLVYYILYSSSFMLEVPIYSNCPVCEQVRFSYFTVNRNVCVGGGGAIYIVS